METVDLRSDTFTLPTQEMREAMLNAAVGDDVFGEDPSVNLLQETAAKMFGKEAAIFVPSGTMGNLAAILAHCQERGCEGLSAPVGSMVVGSRDFISRVLVYRKMLGGGMRQVGVLAAPGMIALTQMSDRLKEDHALAATLAKGISKIPHLDIDPLTVESNVLVFKLKPGLHCSRDDFVVRLKQKGVLCLEVGHDYVRFVTNRHVTLQKVESALRVLREIVDELTQ